MDPELAQDPVAAWLQPYLLVNTILYRTLGEESFSTAVDVTGHQLIYTTLHGDPGCGYPMDAMGSVEFLTRDYSPGSWCDSRVLDSDMAENMLEVVLAEIKSAHSGRDVLRPELTQVASLEFQYDVRKTLRDALSVQDDRTKEVIEVLNRCERDGLSEESLPGLWVAWAQIAPVILPDSGSWMSDLGYATLQRLDEQGHSANVGALESMEESARTLVLRELERLRMAEHIAQRLERKRLTKSYRLVDKFRREHAGQET